MEAQLKKDIETVKNAASKQENDLLAEIRSDQNTITKPRTVSSMGEELKVSFGSYSGANNGWNVYLSLYSDGTLLQKETFVISYEAVTGKKPADLTTADDSTVEDYELTVDMYNSLLLRGDPILYFEMDYSVSTQDDNHPSSYTFSFKEVRVTSTITKKVLQRNPLAATTSRTMTPQWDIRTKEELLAEQKKEENIAKKVAKKKKKTLPVIWDYVLNDDSCFDIRVESVSKKTINLTWKMYYSSNLSYNPTYLSYVDVLIDGVAITCFHKDNNGYGVWNWSINKLEYIGSHSIVMAVNGKKISNTVYFTVEAE